MGAAAPALLPPGSRFPLILPQSRSFIPIALQKKGTFGGFFSLREWPGASLGSRDPGIPVPSPGQPVRREERGANRMGAGLGLAPRLFLPPVGHGTNGTRGGSIGMGQGMSHGGGGRGSAGSLALIGTFRVMEGVAPPAPSMGVSKGSLPHCAPIAMGSPWGGDGDGMGMRMGWGWDKNGDGMGMMMRMGWGWDQDRMGMG